MQRGGICGRSVTDLTGGRGQLFTLGAASRRRSLHGEETDLVAPRSDTARKVKRVSRKRVKERGRAGARVCEGESERRLSRVSLGIALLRSGHQSAVSPESLPSLAVDERRTGIREGCLPLASGPAGTGAGWGKKRRKRPLNLPVSASECATPPRSVPREPRLRLRRRGRRRWRSRASSGRGGRATRGWRAGRTREPTWTRRARGAGRPGAASSGCRAESSASQRGA